VIEQLFFILWNADLGGICSVKVREPPPETPNIYRLRGRYIFRFRYFWSPPTFWEPDIWIWHPCGTCPKRGPEGCCPAFHSSQPFAHVAWYRGF